MKPGYILERLLTVHLGVQGRQMSAASLIIDLTYRCNARCSYCRWGDGRTGERSDLPVGELCISAAILAAAGIGRVVLSGGEPMLHPALATVLAHYTAEGVAERIVITNGLLATRPRVAALHAAGATGFAFSVDSVDPEVAGAARATTAAQLASVLAHLSSAGEYAARHGLELGVNCVLSAANCDLAGVRRLVASAWERGATSLKFQPTFDDGYLGTNAPHLRLGPEHADVILDIGRDAASWPITTNGSAFFADLAATCSGVRLHSRACGLGGRTFVLQSGGLVVCPWIGAPPARGPAPALAAFEEGRKACATGPHCFCLQPRGQVWAPSDAVR